ncbi:hypothetical protein QFC21_006127 [Naganishia friedmannii]|uniref:Uncharacterized protein n=1 Tax=Naganishia friedmannii TaxID=89922 RepID=A0ACC2V453_9TREE|nr:hypothetical protein QFC21_006127 [Naganishia friedmannii]
MADRVKLGYREQFQEVANVGKITVRYLSWTFAKIAKEDASSDPLREKNADETQRVLNDYIIRNCSNANEAVRRA